MIYIFDACALITLLNEEFGKGYETVIGLLESGAKEEVTLYMSLIIATFNLREMELPMLLWRR